jgi:dTDP-glucose pyrophosphorylase
LGLLEVAMKNITVKEIITISQAMRALDETAEKCLLVVDEDNKLLGTLTDGDLRRSILAGFHFSSDITTSYNANPTVVIEGQYDNLSAKQLLRDKKLDLIPVVDEANTVKEYITWSKLGDQMTISTNMETVPIVIMAGGRGTRLEPFTKILPKPLMPIHDKPIIEHIIENFTKYGCQNFYITINYKAKIMKAYFEELDPEYTVNFVDEEEPLGTAGSLAYLTGKLSRAFFVSNCDIIVNTNYDKLYEFHTKGNFDITLVASTKEYIIPYGTCEINGDGHLAHINEKPSYDFLINTGLYIINPDVLEKIPKDTFYHITHLIEDIKNEGGKVGVFPVDDMSWIDIGQWAEYHKAVKEMK